MSVTCPTPNTLVGCRTITLPTNYARVTGSINYPRFSFKFIIEAKGGNTIEVIGYIMV